MVSHVSVSFIDQEVYSRIVTPVAVLVPNQLLLDVLTIDNHKHIALKTILYDRVITAHGRIYYVVTRKCKALAC